MNTENTSPYKEASVQEAALFQIDKQQFGIFLSALRKEKGYTQKELAQKLFVSDKAVSKWERGLSMPDISLLVPLSDVLGVTVTELLKCQHMEHTDKLNTTQVDEILKKAIQISEERPLPKLPSKKVWLFVDLAALLILFIELSILPFNPINNASVWTKVPENLLVGILLGVIFAIFALLTKEKLPDYYDQNKIYGHTNGFFRIQIPGVAMNNHNYPYILFVMKFWAVCMMILYPLLYSVLSHVFTEHWNSIEEIVCLVIMLGSLPLFIVGKKFE